MSAARVWQVDAFTDQPFTGNPAAVCLLEDERDASWMQSLAAEMNLSETAFLCRLDDRFELRWFTPTVEVDLCGHATLASAHVLWTSGAAAADAPIRFQTRSGVLTARREAELIALDFPAIPIQECQPPDGLLESLGLHPTYVAKTSSNRFLLVDTPATVRALQPDFRRLLEVPNNGIIVTAASNDTRFDFVSRFFAPAAGINEDPVTGAAHCCLGPYWSERLGKNELVGYQASRRGGIVRMRMAGERVILSGQAVTIWRGELL